jgi:putative flippase GtrA
MTPMGKTYSFSSRAVVDLLIQLAPRAGIVRFLVSGVLNTCFGYASFLVALRAGAPLTLALVASTMSGTLFNFETSRRIVFQSHEKGRLLAFIGVYAMVFVVDNLVVLALGTLGLDAAIAQAVLVLPLALLSFTAQRRWVFRRKDVR